MNNLVIKANQLNTYLVRFNFQGTSNNYICQGLGLFEVLKNYDKNGIESIKIFDYSKHKFVSCKLSEIVRMYSFETEFYLYLQKHYYFKSTFKTLNR